MKNEMHLQFVQWYLGKDLGDHVCGQSLPLWDTEFTYGQAKEAHMYEEHY